MYNAIISPSKLSGNVTAPPSKSMAHRLLICAGLSKGVSTVSNLSFSKDIIATIKALENIGATIEIDGTTARVKGIEKSTSTTEINCNESGSTLRFMIPIVCGLGIYTIFKGEGKLPSRPITPYIEEFSQKGISFDYNNTMPFSVNGKLKAGIFNIDGKISSQFITGLLFALPLLDGNSEIVLTNELESKSYVEMTISALKTFGIEIDKTSRGWYIKGNQEYKPQNVTIEGDYSQSAFFYVANALENNIKIDGLDKKSCQGDKLIVEIINEISYNSNKLKTFNIDGSDIPDIVPILAVLACFCDGTSKITNIARLKIKESDRILAISECLNKIGGNVIATEDSLIINGIDSFTGGKVDSFNDHRIAMCMAICSTKCTSQIEIINASCVEKSYPDFFEIFKRLGGIVKWHQFGVTT